MKKKYIIYGVLSGILIFVSIPLFHLLSTKLAENKTEVSIPNGFVDDESHLNLTKVDSIIVVKSDSISLIKQIQSALEYANDHKLKISIAGTKHSMGGHTISKNGIQLNMLNYNRMSLDTLTNILSIGSGATWEQAIKYLDKYNRSISIMQAFSTFSIGGSISVNGHGWQKNSPPLSNSVKSFTIMLANGEIKNCSRTNNDELFHLAIGGYGLIGIILDVKLTVAKNISLQYKYINMTTSNYIKHYNEYITNNPNTELVFGRLKVSNKDFLENATLNFFLKTPLTPKQIVTDKEDSFESKRVVFRGSVNSEYGKRLRWDLEKTANYISKNNVYSRNELLNDDVTLIENKDSNSTDILHEYFIPERNFMKFIESIKEPLLKTKIDLLNITIRRVEKDTDAFLNYAKETVYGFVILFNQQKNNDSEEQMKSLTLKLIDCTIESEGTYYLPYRLHVTKEKMREIYPQAERFFNLKLKYDPEDLFSNKFYLKYK